MSATASKPLRIGEVAELTGTTPRTIRYYEEIGLLPGADDRAQGQHRFYSEADVERVREIIRLRDLLGLSLDQLAVLLDAETARAALRRELEHADDPARDQDASSSRRSATSAPSSSSCACAGRRSGSSRRSSWPSGARSTSDWPSFPRSERRARTRGRRSGVDRRAMTVLSLGHMFTDIAQGSIPALLPFLISDRHISIAAASALVLAATISSSVVQPRSGTCPTACRCRG